MKKSIKKTVKFIFLLSLIANISFSQNTQVPINLSPGGKLDTVFDRYGNRYSLVDILKPIVNNSGDQSRSNLIMCSSSSIFNLYFEPGCGMYSTSDPVEIARRNVICKVFEDISNFINTPLTTTGNKVNIWIRNINNVNSENNGVLGLASSYYNVVASNTGGIADGEVWKTITLGVDSYANIAAPLITTGANSNGSGIFYHGMAAFNFNTSNSPAINWHTNLATLPAAGFSDLYSVALHEITHLLGFTSFIDENGISKMGTNYKYFSRYDRFLKNNTSNQFLITNTGSCSNMYNYTFNNANLTTILRPGCTLPNSINTGSPLDVTLCADAIKFVGSNTIPVYTPKCFEQGSSLSHFEDGLFPSCASPVGNNSYFVMSNASSPPAVKRYLKPQERLTLCDIGYRVKTTFGSNTTLNGYYNYGGTACGGIIVAGVNDGLNSDNTYTFNVNQSANLTISGAQLLGNDKNASSFECLQDITGASSLLGTTGTSVTPIVFNSSEPGLHLLRYIPRSSTGQRGNITYVYVNVNGIGYSSCSPFATVCDLVGNGNFEQYSVIPSNLGQIVNACGWTYTGNFASSFFYQNNTYPLVSVPNNNWGNEPDKIAGNKGYAFIDMRTNYYVGDPTTTSGTILATKFTSPLLTGVTYQLSFDVSKADYTYISNNSRAFKMQMLVSNQLIAPSSLQYLTTAQISSGIFMTSPNYCSTTDGWETITFTFTATGGERYLYLGGLNNVPSIGLTPQSNSAGYYIDNVSLAPVIGAINLPNTICNNATITNLSTYLVGVPTNGVFSGAGVTNVSGAYSFIPSVAGNGYKTISYTYYNGTCSVTITKTIQVIPFSLVANNDDFSQAAGTTSITSFLTNDTADGDVVTIYNPATVVPVGTVPTGIILNTNGTISVLATVPLGSYIVQYKLSNTCGVSNTATITITVVPSTIVMAPKVVGASFCYNATTTQTNTISVFDAVNTLNGFNSPCTINGVPCNASNVSISNYTTLNGSPIPSGFFINPNGTTTAVAGTLPVGLTFYFDVCPITTPGVGCVNVSYSGGIGGGVVPMPDVIVVNQFGTVCVGPTNVYTNDFVLDCVPGNVLNPGPTVPATPANTTLTVTSPNQYFNVNASGIISIPNATALPLNNIQSLTYQLCNNALAGNCKTSFVTVKRVADCSLYRSADTTSFEEKKLDKNIIIYPNPSNGIYYLEYDNPNNKDVSISVYDFFGKRILENSFNTNQTIIDLNNFNNGVYLLRIIDDNENISKMIFKK